MNLWTFFMVHVLTLREDAWTRVVVELLPRFGQSVIPQLLPLLDDHNVEAKRAAIMVLEQIRDPSLFDRFVSLTAAEDLEVRCLAAMALVHVVASGLSPRCEPCSIVPASRPTNSQ